ncbi:MAG TPA: DUF2169 domain-containing protein [Enhygromyxa sp.]|nr:DUF2169 domain-containing protein [Enhygromyxa sp.]
MSFVATLDNRTPFAASHCLLPDGQGGEAVLVVVKASFTIDQHGEPQLAESQVDVRLVDEPRPDCKHPSPLWDSDLCLLKPRVDLLLDAIAYAPHGRAAEQVFVELHVMDPSSTSLLSKTLLVSGDRAWDGEAPTRPMPFVSMPLRWERAYGGTRSREQVDERNPLGIGHLGARSTDPSCRSELPNIEDPGATLIRRDGSSVPAGFGTVARAWLPRRALAGTFDEGWKRRRWPLAPRDFDPSFHQSAAPNQQLERYLGDEQVRLVNLTPEGEWCFRLPRIDVPVHLLHADRLERAELRVDTVEIEPELRRVVVTGRVAIAVEPRRLPLEEIVLGHVTRARLEARRTGKCYVDLRGDAGSSSSSRCFR